MARPPAARGKVLDAYISLLCEEGERAATLDATAARAGVSKGGLLYHFASKEALAEAVINASEEHVVRDIEAMDNAKEGASAYFIRTSAEVDTELDRHLVALHRLAQAGVTNAADKIESTNERWYRCILKEVGNKDLAHLFMLAGEGLYAGLALPDSWYQRNFEGELDSLLELVSTIKKLGNLNKH
ncbi:TetR/AcrR family transcriptional regulator [Arthrobacter sp. NIO-1057]|uniref:TetR/AcrR family transcriptional regulator n=1 Tax=Arthrobacter sp. NIO-1057 TaxID=993071 RepID=UPI00071CB5A6|nr:TetR/AcrR family transcriptional regulator [Arthrobacter sp. NIO-1057]KSU64224.1 transcriptional regulator [Arthrobacter sp. NIO-1057]SCC52515.1 transcriptional regulator, TetR family [Arthrobacter sp. NIO-1057]